VTVNKWRIVGVKFCQNQILLVGVTQMYTGV